MYAGCPVRRRTGRVAPTSGAEGEGRQAFTGAVLRVLAPLDGSGCVRGSCELLPEPTVCRDAPTLRGPVSCRSRPWSRSTELSLPEEPYPLSQASCFHVGSRSTAQRRDRGERFAARFPGASISCRGSPALPARPLRDLLVLRVARLQDRDDGSLESLGAAWTLARPCGAVLVPAGLA